MADNSDLLGVGALANIAGGVFGLIGSSGDRQKALDANQQAVQQWLNVNIPDPAQQKVVLQKFVQTGQLDPKLQQAVSQQGTELSKIQTDPSLKGAQLQALSSLQDIGNHGGMDLQSQEAVQQAQNDTNAQARGRSEAVADNFARRGISGSGLEMAAQLQGAQDANNRTSNAQMQAATDARSRALQAIQGSGNLAGNSSKPRLLPTSKRSYSARCD